MLRLFLFLLPWGMLWCAIYIVVGVVAQTEGMIYVLGRPKVIPSYKGDRFLLAP